MSTCTNTLLEALMNLDVTSAEAELVGGGGGRAQREIDQTDRSGNSFQCN